VLAVSCAQAARIRARIGIRINILGFFIVSPIRKVLSFFVFYHSKDILLGF
jgi:hypothetical protein